MRSLGTVSVTALITLLLGGCQGFSDLQDLELARGEASWLPAELAATFGVALNDARNYSEASVQAQATTAAGGTASPEGCGTVQVADELGVDGKGLVQYAFGGCESQAGTVTVNQQVTLDPSTGGGEFPGVPPEVPPGTEADVVTPEDLLVADTAVIVQYAGYRNGMLRSSGRMELNEVGDVGTLATDITVGALDYEGRIAVEGDWSEMADGLASRTSVQGVFESATGVEWTVVADNLVFGSCMEPTGGELLLMFDNGLGRVTVNAVFDDVCDGCAHLSIDGEKQDDACFGDGQTLGGFGQAGAN